MGHMLNHESQAASGLAIFQTVQFRPISSTLPDISSGETIDNKGMQRREWYEMSHYQASKHSTIN